MPIFGRMKKQSSYNLLSFFQNLLEFNKLNLLKDTAINDMLDKYGSLIDSYNYEKGTVTYWGVFSDQHNKEEPTEALFTFDFYSKHKEELIRNAHDTIKAIDRLVYLKAEIDESPKSLLQNINIELHNLSLRADKLYPNHHELAKALKFIENHLLIRYQVRPFAKRRVDEKISYFGVKENVSTNLIKELFWIAEKHNVIDIEITDLNTFIEVLTGNPSNPQSVIHFKSFSYLGYTFLESIKPLFNSLSSKSIGNSKRFYTNRDEVLNSKNYDTLHSRYKDTTSLPIISLKKDIEQAMKL